MTRSIVTIDDLTNNEIEAIFSLADSFLAASSKGKHPWRVRGVQSIAAEHLLATLFYEPSTRTRFSFETAMHRLGGRVISSPSGDATSAAKGESLADTIRVVQNYADIIVIRHPYEGAARLAQEFADVPIVNAGDGSHEHPTQTLCDLYTLRRENKHIRESGSFKNTKFLLWGDLKYGRTIHSLVYALARFGAHIIPVAAKKGLELPDHVDARLRREYNLTLGKPKIGDLSGNNFPIDAIYVTNEKPNQLSLLPVVDLPIEFNRFDVCYVTRFQVERLADSANGPGDYPTVDARFLSSKHYKDSSVLHPLPRRQELSYDLDKDERGIYFRQASYGVPTRMALLAALLELKPGILNSERKVKYATYFASGDKKLPCPNEKCVTNKESEKRSVSPKYWVVDTRADSVEPKKYCPIDVILRCVYCENEIHIGCVAHHSNRTFNAHRWIPEINQQKLNDIVFFRTKEDAIAADYKPAGHKDPILKHVG